MRLMGLGVFKRHVALLKSSFGVRQVPWAALAAFCCQWSTLMPELLDFFRGL